MFSKLFDGLKKTKEVISFKLDKLFSKTEIDADFYDELEEILVTSDISIKVTNEIISILQRIENSKQIRQACALKEELKNILKDILTNNVTCENFAYPLLILVSGVNGAGKTTTIGKLAHYYKEHGKSVLMIAGDTFRAAASEQLEEWARRSNVKIISQGEGADAASVVFDGINHALNKKIDVVLIDTAGRLHNKVGLMDELKKIRKIIDNKWTGDIKSLLVLDGTAGQNAVNQEEAFDEKINIDGLILTKLDGTSKGGSAITIAKSSGKPIYFIGTGEKINDIEKFDANTFVDAIID